MRTVSGRRCADARSSRPARARAAIAGPLRFAFACGLALAAAPCPAAPPDPAISQRYRGIEEGPEQWRRLLLDERGWQVYRARHRDAYACFAFKSAEGEAPPQATGAQMAVGAIAGGHGIKLFVLDRDRGSRDGTSRVQYGLFGASARIGVNTLRVGATSYDYPGVYGGPTLDELLAFEDTRLGIDVTSLPAAAGAPPQRFTGSLDLAGIRTAHAVLLDCHALKETTLSSAPAAPASTAPATASPQPPTAPSIAPARAPVTMPLPDTATGSAPAPATTPAAIPVPASGHVVVPGDTLYSISRRYGCDRDALAKANGIAVPRYVVKLGQTLKLDACN